MSFRIALSKWFGLSGQQKRDILLTILPLQFVELALRVAGLKRVIVLMGINRSPVVNEYLDAQQVREIAQRINLQINRASLICPFHVRCLAKSVYMRRKLLRLGVQTTVCIGVNPAIGKQDFTAHAWLEWNHEVLNDSADVRHQYQTIELDDAGHMGIEQPDT